ncbi:hypothetical protein RZS08_44295, partial [Arthrospira platensis SPKY1]|nr:hypothetical protein [Arthrospira platensis SPKY1]
GAGQRQTFGDDPGAGQGQRSTQSGAHQAGRARQHQDLQQVHGRQPRIAQADRTQGGQRAELALEIGLHAVEDPEAADEQGAESNQQHARADLAQHLAQTCVTFGEGPNLGVGFWKGGDERHPP